MAYQLSRRQSIEPSDGTKRVLVLDKCDSAAVRVLSEAGIHADERSGLSEAELIGIVAQYDAMVVRSATKVTAAIIEAASRMKIIGRAGVGVDNIDVRAATNQGIVVVNSPQGNTTSAAEHTWAMIMSAARQIPQAHNKLKQGTWDRKSFMGLEMEHRTLGILGFGNIGKRVARYGQAFRMKVLAYDPFVTPEQGAKLDVAMVDMNEIFAAADVISLHLPSIKETQRIINAETIGRMKKGVLLVNVARGECVDEAAVAAAVRAGHVARAALDVFAPEPLAKDSPLLEHDNIIVTPHLGASTQEAQVKVAVDVCEQIREVLNGGVAHAALNIPSMKAHLIHPVQHLLDIAETLGRVMVQLAEAKIKSVSLVVADVPPAADLAPVITCFSKGLLSRVHRDGPVNFVNAPALMKEIGIEAEATRAKVGMIANSVLATAVFENGTELQLVGAHVDTNRSNRLLEIDRLPLDVALKGWMLFLRYPDRPGMIGRVGTVIGRHGINISVFRVSPTEDAGAVMVVVMDVEVTDAMVDELKREIPEITNVRLVLV